MEKTRIDEVVSVLGMHFTPRGTETPTTCPLCGKKAKMYINLSTNKCYCHHCHEGGGPLWLYMRVRGISDPKEAGKSLRQEIGGNTLAPIEYKQDVIESELAPIEQRDSAYKEMISRLPLSDRHKKDLESRGLSVEEVNKLGYGSFRFTDGLAHLLQERNISLKGVPGFYSDTKLDKWMVVNVSEGIIVPYLDEHRKISGVQIRKNAEDVKAGKQKYSWLSSRDRNLGTGAVTSVHYACDWVQNFLTGEYSPVLRRGVLLTEGGMKADIAHMVTGEPIIAVPGVSCLKALSKALSYLKSRGVEEIIDILDMDYLTNPNVAEAMQKIKSMVAAKGLRYSRRNWSTKGDNGESLKGYDDYVTYMRTKK